MQMNRVSIFAGDELVKIIIGIQRCPGIPRVVYHLNTAMEVCSGDKMVLGGEVHKGHCFRLPRVPVGMRPHLGIGVIAV